MLRKELVRLISIPDTVRKYASFNGQLQCPCPFHKGPDPTLIWNAKTGTYRCDSCKASGDLIDFVMKMENWTYFQAYQKLAGRLRHVERGIVYVLALADDCYYIGYTLDLVKRTQLHFSGKGAYWTQQHPPIRIVKVFYDVTYAKENRVTEQYFVKYGRDKVRGGRYVGVDLD